jgi:hypothetical protein
MGVEVEAIILVCGLENWESWCPPARHFYTGPGGGTYSCTRVMVNGSIENVETVTDKAEYRTRSVSAREVGWQTCPGVLFIERVSESAFRTWPA